MTVTAAQIGKRLKQYVERAYETVDEVARRSEEAARTEHAHKLAYARALLRAEGTVSEKEAKATVATESLLLERLLAENLLRSSIEALRTHRDAIKAGQTSAAALRAEMDMTRTAPRFSP